MKRLLSSFVAGVLVAACAASDDSVESSITARARASAPVSYERLVDLVQQNDIRSIDALLARPELSLSFRRRFTAMFRSHSIQHADPANPRIILYGGDATTVLAFTCAPGDCDDASTHLEILQWRAATKSFELRDIEFPEGREGKPVFSEANPEKCLACHEASDPRPNWEPYNQWPGAYGGNDDGAQPKYLVEGESRADLEAFIARAPTRPRYRNLNDVAGGYQYEYDYNGVHYNDSRTATHHNIDLNEALYLLNDERIVDRVRKLPFYDDIKHALVLGLGGGSFSAPLRAIGRTDLAQLVDQCATGYKPASRMVQVLYGLGVDSLPWFMSFGADRYSELAAPGFAVEGKVETALVALDHDLDLDYNERTERAQDGWRRLIDRLPVADRLARCTSGD